MMRAHRLAPAIMMMLVAQVFGAYDGWSSPISGNEGVYDVTLPVWDDDGGVGSDTVVITCSESQGDDSPESSTWVLLGFAGAVGTVVRRRWRR